MIEAVTDTLSYLNVMWWLYTVSMVLMAICSVSMAAMKRPGMALWNGTLFCLNLFFFTWIDDLIPALEALL